MDKPFYGELVAFLTRSPVFAMVVEGPADNTFSLVRKLVGATKVDDAEPGTIRGDFATITTENLVHGSDGHEIAPPARSRSGSPDALTSAAAGRPIVAVRVTSRLGSSAPREADGRP